MGLLGNIFNNIKNNYRQNRERFDEELHDGQTRDRYLLSLRRQRRLQLEQMERKRLELETKAYQNMQERKVLGLHSITPARKPVNQQPMLKQRNLFR